MAYSNHIVNTTGKYRPRSHRLMDQVREVLRYHYYRLRRNGVYIRWVRQFI